MSLYALVSLTSIVDERGHVAVGDVGGSIPFDVRRVFTVSGVPAATVRGGHAHRDCHQLLVVVSGSVRVDIRDSAGPHTVVLSDPAVGVHIPPGVFAAQSQFTHGAVLLVLASHPYDPDDYIDGSDVGETHFTDVP